MGAEIFNIAMPDKALIFIVSKDGQRISAFGRALHQMGAMEVGPQMFVIGVANDLAEMVRDAVGELLDGESVYVLRPNSDQISQQVIVRPRTDGGIVVR